MSTAEKNNEKLFPLFRRNLTESNVNLYAATADKLATWASRDKAYYPFARPVIVELLETAHTQVRHHSGSPDKPFHISDYPESLKPWAEPFIKLLRTIVPFFCLFSEPDLQTRLRALLQTIDIDPLVTGPVEQPILHTSPSAALFRPADRATHSASPVNQPSLSINPLPSLFGIPRAKPPRPTRAGSGTSAVAPSLQHPTQANSLPGSATPPVSTSPHRLVSPPITIHASLASMQQEQRHSPAPLSPGTPGMASSVLHISGHLSGSAPPRVGLDQSVVAGPSSLPSASPTISTTSSPVISSATPADSLKRKAKKRKKRLTDDDFIMADLADWESARASKASQFASPSLVGAVHPTTTAESTISSQAEPVAGIPSNASNLNGSRSRKVSSAVAPHTESSKQPSPALAVSTPAQGVAAPVAAQETLSRPSASGEQETKPSTPAPVVPSGGETDRAAPLVEQTLPPTLSTAAFPEVGREKIASPSSTRTGRKKRPSQEFRFISENRKLPMSLSLTRKKKSPPLLVFRLDPRSQVNGVQPDTLPTNGHALECVDEKRDVKLEDDLPEQTHFGVAINGEGDAKVESSPEDVPPTPEDASRTAQEQGTRYESPPVPAAEELSTKESDSTPIHASDRCSEGVEDVEMIDELQDSEVDQTEPSPKLVNADGDKAADSAVAWAEDGPATDVKVEPSAGQCELGTDAFKLLRPSPVASVATFQLRASPVLGHTQQEAVVKAHTGDVGIQLDAQPSISSSPSTITSTLIEPPLPATFEGVMQELAEKKGVSDTIVSRIVNAMSEEPNTGFKLAPAEWHTVARSPSPSEASETSDSHLPLEPIVPQKRPCSHSPTDDGEERETSRKRLAKSFSPATTPQAIVPEEPVSALPPPEPKAISDSPHCSSVPALESAVTIVQSTPAPTEDPIVPPIDDAFAQEVPPPDSHRELGAEIQEGVTASMTLDTTEESASAQETPAPEGEQATEPHPRTPEAQVTASQDTGEDHAEGDMDNDAAEPPVMWSTLLYELVEEGEIQTPVATTPTPVDINGPLAYSDLRVLDCRRGSAEHELAFEFQVDASLLASLSRWVGRYKSIEDVSQDHCVSFSCYPFNDCVDYIRAYSEPGQISSYEKLGRSVVMQWPKDGRLWAELVNSNGVHKVIMSPPYLRNTEQVVDLSDYVVLGNNVLHVYQLRDHSDFVFTLNVHTPVPSQLRELQERRDHDASWKAFLRSVSTFVVPEFPWSTKAAMVQT